EIRRRRSTLCRPRPLFRALARSVRGRRGGLQQRHRPHDRGSPSSGGGGPPGCPKLPRVRHPAVRVRGASMSVKKTGALLAATALQYPAFVALGTGTTPPGYPFYVKADANEGDKTLADPTGSYQLQAKAGRETAESLSRLRGAVGDAAQSGSISTTSIKHDSG